MRSIYKAACTLMIISSLFISGCNLNLNQKPKEVSAKVYTSDVNSDISITEKEGFFSKEVIQKLEQFLKEGATIREGLEQSGLVNFDDKGNIQTISHVTLSPDFVWGFEINGKKIGEKDLDTILSEHDQIAISIQSSEHVKDGKPLLFSVLKLNGGSIKPDLTHTYVFPYADNQTVRDMLKSSNHVELSLNNKKIASVNGYSSKSVEKWTLKVNGKELIETGMDMRLSPQDEVEVRLDRS